MFRPLRKGTRTLGRSAFRGHCVFCLTDPLCTSYSGTGTPTTPFSSLLDSAMQREHIMFKNTILPHAATKNTLLWAVRHESDHHANSEDAQEPTDGRDKAPPCLESTIGISRASKRAIFCANTMWLEDEVTGTILYPSDRTMHKACETSQFIRLCSM